MLVSSSLYRLLPIYPGVYIFKDESKKIIYVGKALNLKNRVASYFTDKNLGEKTKALVSQIKFVETIEVTSEIEAFLLEERLIKKYKPKYNVRFADGKTYAMLQITKEEYPKVLITRKEIDDGSIYFGPYTSANTLRIVLKLIRRIFPYESANHQGKICLYNHLGLCTCPSVTKDPNYKTNIKHITDFLSGKTKKVIIELEKERNLTSKKEEFEKSIEFQRKIDSIELITSPFYKPFYFMENPNLRNDIVAMELNSLKNTLIENNVNVRSLLRIECYDISNFSGKHATGSMVVFTHGERDSSSYRRFKIKRFYNDKPNDFAMIEEVLTRRFSHTDWPVPDLIIVDGGRGQVSTAGKVLKKIKIKTSYIGLAKREEIIITSDLKEIKLPKDSKALHLIMRIRDEAHRFAIAYHKKLRSKIIFE